MWKIGALVGSGFMVNVTEGILGQCCSFLSGRFLKAPRNHVPVLLLVLMPPRWAKASTFFMKRRHKLLTGNFLCQTNRTEAYISLKLWISAHLKRQGEWKRKQNEEVDGEDREQWISWPARSNRNVRGRGLFCPCAAMRENQACSASNFHMSISAQLRTALWNQSGRKYPWGTAEWERGLVIDSDHSTVEWFN